MSTEIFDILIIGAGPIGGYLSWILSSRGYKVLVLDKTREAGDKVCCTGIISTGCLRQLAIDSTIKNTPVHTVKLISPSGKQVTFHRSDPIAHVIDRPALNKMLVNRSIILNTQFLFSTEVTGLVKTTELVEVEAISRGLKLLFRAKLVVVATGYSTAALTKKTGLGNIRDFIIGAQSEVEMQQEHSGIEIYMDHSIAPGGFAWLVPAGANRGLAGMLCRKNPRHHQEQFLNKLKTTGKVSYASDQPGFGLIPLSALKKTCDERILVIGEAAGQVKPATGGGIYYGILCAHIAADIAEKAFKASDFSLKQMSGYEQRWHKLLGNEITLGHYLQKIYSSLGNGLIDDLFLVMQRRHVSGTSVESIPLHFDWHSKAILQLMRTMISSHKNK